MTILLLFVTFFVLVGIGVPIAFAMGLSALSIVLWEPFTTAVVFQRMVAVSIVFLFWRCPFLYWPALSCTMARSVKG